MCNNSSEKEQQLCDAYKPYYKISKITINNEDLFPIAIWYKFDGNIGSFADIA